MTGKMFKLCALTGLIVLATLDAQATVTFDWATIGNAGNAADPETGVGSVHYEYRISKHEVTNAQYVEFLNAVASSKPYGYNPRMGSWTWGGIIQSGSPGSYSYSVKPDAVGVMPDGSDFTYKDKPVIEVSWYNAIRFINWLHNGQGNGDTENGAYTLTGGSHIPSNALSITRDPSASFFLPNEDEWYKAAFHESTAGTASNYFRYVTGTYTRPNNNPPSADTGNSANFRDPEYTTGIELYPLTDVGAYNQSPSSYGTFDQGGNVYEWNETLFGSMRGDLGGAYYSTWSSLRSLRRNDFYPSTGGIGQGFRVASIVPEPASIILLAMSGLEVLRRRMG